MQHIRSKSQSIALACGVLGVLAALWVYWMILPGLILGAVAVVLGWRSRHNGVSELGSVAMTTLSFRVRALLSYHCVVIPPLTRKMLPVAHRPASDAR